MISAFDVRYQFLRPRQHIEERLYAGLLISTIFYSGFFSSEAFDKLNQSSQNDVADKHARYISEI